MEEAAGSPTSKINVGKKHQNKSHFLSLLSQNKVNDVD